jgi:hypothetical protein
MIKKMFTDNSGFVSCFIVLTSSLLLYISMEFVLLLYGPTFLYMISGKELPHLFFSTTLVPFVVMMFLLPLLVLIASWSLSVACCLLNGLSSFVLSALVLLQADTTIYNITGYNLAYMIGG